MCHNRYKKFIEKAYVHYNIMYIISLFPSTIILFVESLCNQNKHEAIENHKYIIQDIKRLAVHFLVKRVGYGRYGYHLITGLNEFIYENTS